MSELSVEKVVRPGDRIDLMSISESLSDEIAEEEGKYYISKVYDITDDGRVEVIMPMEKTKVILLSVGTEFDVFFYAKKGIYTCQATVVERYKNDTLFVVVLELTTELIKQQRREYYRYGCIIGMVSRELSETEEAVYEEKKRFVSSNPPSDKGVIVDISGGGIRFISPAKYELGKQIVCRFMLKIKEQTKTYDTVITLLAKQSVENNPRNMEYRGQFLHMPEAERETIIQYIFDEERRMLKKR